MKNLIAVLILFLATTSFNLFGKEMFSSKSVIGENYLLKSYEYEEEKQYQQAINEVLKIKHKKYFYHLRLGWLFYLKGQYQNSLHYYELASSLKPKAITAYSGIAHAHISLGNNEYAIKILEKCLSLSGRSVDISLLLIDLYVKTKNYKKGLILANDLYSKYPENPSFLEYLILLNKELGDKKKVYSYIKELRSIDPSNVYAFNILEQLSIKAKD